MIAEAYEKLSHPDRRLLARCAGKSIEEVPRAIIPVYQVMNLYESNPETGKQYRTNETAFFAALCIRCIFEETDGPVVAPEELFQKARNSKKLGSVDGYDRRIASMMSNTETEFFIQKLAKLIKYAGELTGNLIPDCDQLYKDICFIDSNQKTVQRRWAKVIYTGLTENGKEEENE